MAFTAADIARHLRGEVVGDASTPITGFSPADRSRPGDVTFAENESYLQRAETSAAAAVIVEKSNRPSPKVLIRVSNARVAFARVLPLFFPEKTFTPGVAPTAVVAASARIDPSAHVGPGCVIGEDAQIGPRCVLEALDFVGDGCRLGEAVRLFPNVTLYSGTEVGSRVRIHAGTVVGSDGFGYVQEEGSHLKVPQIGNVIIRDDVELGANVTVDRGALGPTVIGAGTKVDNLVQIAHNVGIGENCLIVAQSGVAGSTKIGDEAVIGGQSGISGHLRIGNGVTVGAQSGVIKNLRDGERVWGYPAVSDRQAKRQMIAVQHLPEMVRRVQELERRLARFENEKR
ncbi:MAG: UDP-3-O-(3-hydroxymyristoyl)glucosamine N-acyltransferase [Verrucomicrobia bacterium]|jgi:UDP-3-O-[3-hydroxymyristoyl] glucosamine N-acyltransferase|nr:UDP-3-O-(3-hydroxymyristoyl)glucosamine N-acyltransferase [Verrucomicrobiota bacterium]